MILCTLLHAHHTYMYMGMYLFHQTSASVHDCIPCSVTILCAVLHCRFLLFLLVMLLCCVNCLQSTCDVGVKKGTERQVLLFEKLLLILKKKDTKRYNYKAHIVVREVLCDDPLPYRFLPQSSLS